MSFIIFGIGMLAGSLKSLKMRKIFSFFWYLNHYEFLDMLRDGNYDVFTFCGPRECDGNEP